jgi:hypothetical protein
MLFLELVKVVGDWLWRNGRFDNMSELGPSYLDGFMAEIAKDRMACIGGEGEPIMWCGSPL